MLKEETKPPLDSEDTPKDLPCIFGKEICSKCPVRKDINEHKNPDISKYIRPREKMLDGADEIINMFTDALSMQYGTLSSFCDVCPFLTIFINNKTP